MEFVIPISLGDIVASIILTSIILYVMLSVFISWANTWFCKHEEVRETMSCDAICIKCGKNLGFIGVWREQHGVKKPGVTVIEKTWKLDNGEDNDTDERKTD
jgi:hypothetical protein